MKTNHTGGIWSINKWGQVVDSRGEILLLTGVALTSGNHPRQGEAKANAILIAAAPELLEALIEIIKAADGEGWKQLDPGFKTARAAVAKATRREK